MINLLCLSSNTGGIINLFEMSVNAGWLREMHRDKQVWDHFQQTGIQGKTHIALYT